jgi:hypothetical protein
MPSPGGKLDMSRFPEQSGTNSQHGSPFHGGRQPQGGVSCLEPEPGPEPGRFDSDCCQSAVAAALPGPKVKRELRGLGTRICLFGITAVSISVDLAFLVAWVWLHRAARNFYEHLGGDDSARGTVLLLEWVFSITTLVTLLSYIGHDLWMSVKRHWNVPVPPRQRVSSWKPRATRSGE